MLFPIFPTFPDPYPTHEAQGFKKIIHHLEAMPVDSQEEKKKSKADHWIWFNLRNFSSKILEIDSAFPSEFFKSQVPGASLTSGAYSSASGRRV